MDHRPELRAALAPGERQPQRTEVATRRLQLAHGLAGIAVHELLEPLERRPRLSRQLHRLGLEDLPGVLARFLEISRAAHRGNELRRYVNPRRELLVRHGRDRLDGEPVDPCEVELNVVPRQAELVEVRAHGLGRDACVAEIGDGRHRVTLGELAAVRPEHEADGACTPEVSRRAPRSALGGAARWDDGRSLARRA